MEKHWDILSFGVVTVDDLYTVPQFPQPETKTPVTSYERQGGGLSGTALVAAARLGARCAYAGVLGHDELSDYVLREFDREGVDCSLAGRRDGIRPIHSVIIIDAAAHTRTIFFNRLDFHSRTPDEISPELIEPARVLFVDHYGTAATIRALQIARAAGVQSVADIERDNEDPRIAAVIELVDHLIVSAEFAYVLTGQRDPAAAADALASVPRACTAVTCGADGCWYKTAGSARPAHQPAFRVDVVDTTGCGDIFHGAYAAMIAKDCTVPDAIRRASAAAAIKAMHTGRSDLDFILASYPNAPMAAFLDILRDKVRSGYLRAGFIGPQVDAAPHRDDGRVVVTVNEGQHYDFDGTIVVEGARTVPADAIVAYLLAEDDPDGRPSTPPPAEPTLASLLAKRDWNGGRPLPYRPGEPAARDPLALKQLDSAVKRAFAWLGHPFAQATVEQQSDPNTGKASLLVHVQDEGPRAILKEIELTGCEKNTREDVMKYLGLEIGMLIDGRKTREKTVRPPKLFDKTGQQWYNT